MANVSPSYQKAPHFIFETKNIMTKYYSDLSFTEDFCTLTSLDLKVKSYGYGIQSRYGLDLRNIKSNLFKFLIANLELTRTT